MFISLRFPDGSEYPEIPLSVAPTGLDDIIKNLTLSDLQKKTLLHYLPLSCPHPDVLSYRAEFAAEVFSNPDLQRIFRGFSLFSETGASVLSSEYGTPETDKLQRLTWFETFAKRLDAFRTSLEGISPESAAAKRFFLFLRNYTESFEYLELKTKAAELRRAFAFEYGCTLTVGNPSDPEGVARLRKKTTPPDGVRATADRVLKEFGVDPKPEPNGKPRPYTHTEAAVLTGMIRKDSRLARKLEEFTELYGASGADALMRLSEEALYYISLNEIYRWGHQKGYTVCRPVFRKPGFYGEIFGLNYLDHENTVQKTDYLTSPLNHITVVCGPDGENYLRAVAFAHLCASAGGLIFAEGAEISPVNCLEGDQNERIRTDGLNEAGLCICNRLFDVMLPRQEEAAVSSVIQSLNDRHPRSVIRICSKSNLSVLQKKIDGGRLPPCTLLQLGNDRTLEELLQRHKLTAQCLEEDEEHD